MSKGKVKEYNLSRGCGVICDFSTGQDLVFYANYITLEEGETLKEGQKVEYEIENKRNEKWAVNIRTF